MREMPSVKVFSNCKGMPKARGAEDGELVGGIDALDIEGGIGLGVAQGLGLGQDVAKSRGPCRASR